MNRNKTTENSTVPSRQGRFDWIYEIAIFAVITPALVYGVVSLNNLPVA